MYESFYGGKQGRSYQIVERYDSVYDMVTAFQGGTNYTDVAFDEYVLIDTILNNNQKHNIENGLLYRRGYNSNEAFYDFGTANTTTLDRERTISVTIPVGEFGEKYTAIWNDDGTLNINLVVDNETEYRTVLAPEFYDFEYTFINPTQEGSDTGDDTGDDTGEDTGEDTEPSVNPEIEYSVAITKLTFNQARWSVSWNSYITNPGGGAIYIGQIVGSAGETPSIRLISWEEFEQATNNNLEQYQNNFIVHSPPGHISLSGDETSEELVELAEQGYDENGNRDIVRYGYCTFRDAQGNIEGIYLALDIPYTIFNFEAHGISAYPEQSFDENTNEFINDYTDSKTGIHYHYNIATNLWEYDNLISENADSTEHNFYKHYDINIPKGVHGRDISNFKILTLNKDSQEYQDPYIYDDQNNIIGYNESFIDISDDGANFNENFRNQFLTYQTTDYNRIEAGETSAVQSIAPYKIITDIDTTQRQTASVTGNYAHSYPNQLIINYTYGEPTIVDYSLIERIWIQIDNSVNQYGVEVNTSHADTNNPTYTGIHLLRKSHLYVLYSNEMRPRDLGLINFAERIWVQTEPDSSVNDVTGQPLIENHIYIQMSADTNPTDLGLIKKLEDIWIQAENDDIHPVDQEIDNNGHFVKEDYIYAKLTNETYPHELGFVRKIVGIEKDLTDQNYYVHYNYDVNGQITDDVKELLPINEIDQIDFVGDLFLIHFKNFKIPETFQQAYVREDGEVWLNLGTVVKGNHVWTNFNTYEDLILDYPNGLDNAGDISVIDRAGWLVTVGHEADVLINIETHNSISETIAFLTYDAIQDTNIVTLPENSTAILTYDNETQIYTITFTEPITPDSSEEEEEEETPEGTIPAPIQCKIESAVGYKLYGFDYRENRWYAIQDMTAGAVNPEYSILVAPATQYGMPDHIDANQLNPNGIWLIEV